MAGVVHAVTVKVLRVGGMVRFQARCGACPWVGDNHADRFAAFRERDEHEFEAAREAS